MSEERVKITVCVPVRDINHSQFTYSLTLACCYLAQHHKNVDVGLLFNNGTLIQEQRTDLAKKALSVGSSWVIFCDSDMTFPANAFEQLLKHKKPIVGANYSTRKWPWIQPVTFKTDAEDSRVYTRPESSGLEEVAATGFGLIAVHKLAFERIEQPWFFVPYNVTTNKHECGEDIWFCRRARKAGLEVFIDHDLSKQVGHVGTMEWTYEHSIQQEGSDDLRKMREAALSSELNGLDLSEQKSAA
jgi:hypothetical protein